MHNESVALHRSHSEVCGTFWGKLANESIYCPVMKSIREWCIRSVEDNTTQNRAWVFEKGDGEWICRAGQPKVESALRYMGANRIMLFVD